VGNGGATSTYTWTQTLYDLTVHVCVPPGTKVRAPRPLRLSLPCGLLTPHSHPPRATPIAPPFLFHGRRRRRCRRPGATDCQAKGVKCDVQARSLSVGMVGSPPILKGVMPDGGVIASECMWTLVDGKTVVLHLHKVKHTW
jgi:hypothetical protein